MLGSQSRGVDRPFSLSPSFFLSVGVILLIRPSLVNKFWRHLLLAIVVIWGITYIPIFQEGLEILSTRFVEAAESD